MCRFHHFRRTITALLSIWTMVIGMGVSVSHAHAEGESQHVHGSGWNHAAGPILPLKGSNNRGESHRHLILLGFEFPNESAPGMADASVTVPAIESTSDLPASYEFTETDTVLANPVIFTFLVRDCTFENEPYPLDSSVTLCTFARRVLTGVLRS